jgi:hypothetical protein
MLCMSLLLIKIYEQNNFLFVKISPVPFPVSKRKQKLTQILTFQRYVKDYVVYVTFVTKKFYEQNNILFIKMSLLCRVI